ncbi:MAG: hypothetical protein H6813_06075 [Phycisphaeraceae bacterium]|nr:hypothetical protein [Phycisphaeraceae bacterium]MCB9848037.1 hypothetical protein [Phycisphaeraceae bacterium]
MTTSAPDTSTDLPVSAEESAGGAGVPVSGTAERNGVHVAPAATRWPGRPTHARRVADESGSQVVEKSVFDKLEAWLSRLSTKNHFWRSVCSLIWLPFAFRSGLRVKRVDKSTFTAVLPFKRFNRNWYNAMAGGALLANSEIAGGMYVFGVCGGDYTVVCKELRYRFLRPCFGPAIYKIRTNDDVEALVAAGGEFNIDLTLDIVQQLTAKPSQERRVGRCECTFHVTPKLHHKAKKVNAKQRRARKSREKQRGA